MWSGRRLALWGALGIAALTGWFLWRDLHLPQQAGVPADLPDVRVEQLDLQRRVGEQDWSIRTARAERSEGVARVVSLDLDIRGPGDRVTRIRAEKGRFEEENEDMTLWHVQGSLREKGRTTRWTAGEAFYDGKVREWRFPSGVNFQRETLRLTAQAGRLLPKGEIRLVGGVSARWVAPR